MHLFRKNAARKPQQTVKAEVWRRFMNSSQVRCFLMAAEYQSFTKAAEKLFMSQPGLSRQIVSLEDELGVTLFTRGRNFITLTDAGKICEEYLKRITNEYSHLIDNLKQIEAGRHIPLNIGALEGQLIGKCYEKAISWFWRNKPEAELKMAYFPASKLYSSLIDGAIDVAIMAESEIADLPDISYKRARRDRLCLVVPADHPMAGAEHPSLFDFSEDTFLLLDESDSSALSTQIKSLFVSTGFEPKEKRVVPTFATLAMLLESGAGVSVLNKWHSLGNAPYLKFLEVPEIGYRNEAVVWCRNNQNPFLHDFIDLIEEVVED